MDKDVVILKNQQLQVEDIKKDIQEYSNTVDTNIKDIASMNDQVDGLLSQLGLSYEKKQPLIKVDTAFNLPDDTVYDYEELFQKSINSLLAKGIDVNNLSYTDLLDEDVIRSIEVDLNRPLPRREKWTRDDKIIVFVAALVGVVTDFIFGDRNNPLTGKDSEFSKWLDGFHDHPDQSPMDYQGKGFGGGDHRVLSKMHDLARFAEVIWQVKNGTFVGVRHEYGQAIKVVSNVNQYGNPYEQMSLLEAIGNYFQHMKGDFFSKNSLPIPGYSFFMESDNRDLRKFAATMYKQGFNMKNVAIQSISTLCIELILRVYFAVVETKKLIAENRSINILEDFSNVDNIKGIVMPASNPKYREMFLVAHALVTAINIGKVIIKKAPWEINITEIFMTIRYLVPYIKDVLYRHSDIAKLDRNTIEITGEWDRLLQEIDAKKIVLPMPKNELILV